MSTSALCIGVNGASGRMGRRIVALTLADESLELVAAIEATDSPELGQDAGGLAGVGACGVIIADSVSDECDVIIDFSTPAGLESVAEICRQKRIPLVAATTGLSDAQREQIAATAKVVPVVFAPSMSLAVNIAMKLVADAARAMRAISSGVDVEIIERHHRYKEDAPSGTALRFGQLIAEQMGQTEHVHGRRGKTGRRPQSEIGYHALRTGDNVGEHTIVFGALGETLELTVRGHNRDSYAQGALTAARFVVNQPAGLYGMAEVLGL